MKKISWADRLKSTRFRILNFIFLMLLIVLFFNDNNGFWIINNIKDSYSHQFSQEGIHIYTDKSDYFAGEAIKITIENKSNNTIFIYNSKDMINFKGDKGKYDGYMNQCDYGVGCLCTPCKDYLNAEFVQNWNPQDRCLYKLQKGETFSFLFDSECLKYEARHAKRNKIEYLYQGHISKEDVINKIKRTIIFNIKFSVS